jgi:hypothetical protein
MKAFEDGQRVRYVGIEGLTSEWKGREGVVTDSYREYDGNRVEVLMDGETESVSFDEDDLEAVKATYEIENWAEDFPRQTGATSATLDLTDAEAALVQRVIETLNEGRANYAPTMTIKKKEKP